MDRGTPRPPRGGFNTPNNRQQPYAMDQRNTVNIPFYRDTGRDNRNFGTPQNHRHFRPRGGFQDNRRFNDNRSFTPRHNGNRPQQHAHRSFNHKNNRDNVDISQFFHPSMLEDPWKDLVGEGEERRERPPSPGDTENQNQLI